MAQNQPDPTDLISVIDSFHSLKDTQYLLQSIRESIVSHSNDKDCINRIQYLFNIYYDKVNELMPELEKAIEKVQPDNNDKSLADYILYIDLN